MPSAARELFIYYRVRDGAESRAAEIVDTFQSDLMAQIPALRARWLRKDDATRGGMTWMETYALDSAAGDGGAGVDHQLQAEIERVAAPLNDCIDGARHVEAFRARRSAGAV